MVLNLFFTFTLFQNFSLFAGPYFCKKQTRMKERILPYLALFAFLATGSYFAFASKGAAAPPATRPRDPEMLAAAKGFLGSLTAEQRQLTQFTFDNEGREAWNFVPMVRQGLAYQKMSIEQRQLCLHLVRTGLSAKGYMQAKGIMGWEQILSELEGRQPGDNYRNPELYYLAIFGEPAADEPWGWRFEGHHLSLNYTSVTGALSVTPQFMGTNPARVPSGEYAGMRLMADEEDLARQLVLSFDDAQHRLAVISATAFPGIVTGAGRVAAALGDKKGLPYEAMLPEQQELLDMLIKVYLGRMPDDVADAKWRTIQKEEMAQVSFAWAGSLRQGEGHYYRILGKSFLVEYDNTQNDANHIHTVWRDFTGDFGRDLLREHYQHSH